MHRRFVLRSFAVLSVLAVVAAACSKSTTPTASGSASGGSSNCPSPTGCVTVAAGAPIEIGTLLAISGDNKDLGLDSQYGVRLAVDYLDGKFDGVDGQIDGHAVKLVNQDDGCSAEGGQTGATALAADPQIVGVIGTSCSSASLGVADKILSAKYIVTISPSATNPALTAAGTHQPYYFRTAHNDRIQAAVVSDFALQKLNAKTAVTIHDESPYTQGLTDGFKANFEAGGGTVTDEEADQQRRQGLQVAADEDRAEPAERDLRAGLQPGLRATSRSRRSASAGWSNTTLHGLGRLLRRHVPHASPEARRHGVYLSGPDLTSFSQRGLLQEPVPARPTRAVRLLADLGVPRARVRRLQHPGGGDHGIGREEQRRLAHDPAGGAEGRCRVDEQLPGHHRAR